jgi:formate C-acetyltransferase
MPNGRDEISGEQVGPKFEPVKGDVLDFDDVIGKFEQMMDWLAGVYVSAMNIIHYTHDKYAYERLEMALHDYAPLRTMAFGMAGMSVVADSLSAIKFAKVHVIRDETGLITGRFKWQKLGLDYSLADAQPPSVEATERACQIFRDAGLTAY